VFHLFYDFKNKIINFVFGRAPLAFENVSKCFTYFMILKTKL